MAKGVRRHRSHKYRTVENALWGLYGSPGAGLGAFRARVRHLRNIGVPDLPTPGTGNKLDYAFAQVLELAIALSLEAIGLKPSGIVGIAQVAAAAVIKNEGADCYLIVMPEKGGLTAVSESRRSALTAWVDRLPSALIVNAAQIAKAVEAALDAAAATM